ncbi:nucleotidyltransferase [Alkalihalophilus marmarensis]|jgi:predicted nucleotidyltransferase|uniref:tRNA(Met) cytidine acetate ligase n=1 Tax=Alkalihalophilus marmarensis DSM 21297 TaxID=1188261 RepID=U6SNE1_9BACI|nr:nucleotidyltransferase [Alkalihalophilus marmarensis]ERN53254.1 hypothetical protein A33I_12960 [Alkalihalophilus marmarensis DSM 21297]MCM3489696.1 nucleotidyltransferase [Alkalihalophilus marmarensis]
MKSVGVVVEYNPLHNGHAYHLQEARRMSQADVVVAVMSGSFLQRGEPAIISKWERAEMALHSGADVIVELPYAYSTQKAQTFAEGAVRILNHLKVDCINFGSEIGEIESFIRLVNFMHTHKDAWDELVRNQLQAGVSYPRACMEAFNSLDHHESILSLSEPNNILGYHYTKAIIDSDFNIEAQTTKRTSANYHDPKVTDHPIASATSIRKKVMSEKGDLTGIKHVVPYVSMNILERYQHEYGTFHSWDLYFPLLQFEIERSSIEQLREIYECEEGLEYRLKDTISNASNFKEWMEALKTKRYTWTRLQRLLTHVLTNTTKQEMKAITSEPLPYIRLLGMNPKGKEYVNLIKKNLDCPLLSRFAKARGTMAAQDDRIGKIYAAPLAMKGNIAALKRDYTMSPIMIK